MADALPGAVAPIPAAVRAAVSPTTTQHAAELPAPMVLHRVNRMLALVDLARALPEGDTPFPADGATTDRDQQLAALLHCLSSELQALHLVASSEVDSGPAVQAVAVPAAAAGDPVPSLADEVCRLIGAAVGQADPGDADIVIELVEALRHLSLTWAGAPNAVDPAAAVEILRTVTARERGVSAERLKLIDTASAALLLLEVAGVAGVPIAPDADRVGCPQRPAPSAALTAVHQSAPDAVELTQRVGELACLVAMAADLAADADGAGDMGGLWRLRCLLGAMRPQADSLHEMAALAEGGAA